jgi:hypothetical protein
MEIWYVFTFRGGDGSSKDSEEDLVARKVLAVTCLLEISVKKRVGIHRDG